MNLRSGLVLFLALVVLDGAVRKWLLPEWEQLVYIAKDVLLLGLLCACLARHGSRAPAGLAETNFPAWMGVYACIVGLQALNPSLPSVFLGLFGLKAHVLYAALVLVVPAAFRDTRELAQTLRYLLVPAILVLGFGVLQFSMPADHPINRYVRGAQDIATFGLVGNVRITSTFSYVSGMTSFVFFALCLSSGMLAAGRWRFLENKLATACLVAAVVVTPMTGARWIYYMAVLCVPVFLYSLVRSDLLQVRHAWRLIAIASLAFFAISYWSLEALESLEYRRHSTSDTPERIEGMLSDPVRFGAEAGLLGYGAGATHQAAPVLMRTGGEYPWLPVAAFENETGRIMLELGAAGFVIAFALRLYLCRLAWLALTGGGSRAEKGLAAAALVFALAHILSPIVFNGTSGALYWFMAGVVATILRDQRLRRAAAAVAPAVALPPGAVRARP